MESIVICEKSSQRRNLMAAVGETYGPIIAMEGHCFEPEPPPGADDWKGLHVLVPADRRFRWRPLSKSPRMSRDQAQFVDRKLKILAELKKLLPKTKRVIIATDDDEEGEWIGWAPLEHFGFRGQVLRATFSREDKTTLRRAFEQLEDGRKYYLRAVAAKTRAEADLAAGYSLTAAATICLRPPNAPRDTPPLAMGRVKNGVVDMLCGIEHAIRTFTPIRYHDLKAVTDVPGLVLVHAPPAEARILDRATADFLAGQATGFSGPVTVATERKRRSPPPPFSMTSLQQEAGRILGWEPSKMDAVANVLYRERGGIITYPRSEAEVLDVDQQEEAAQAMAMVGELFPDLPIPAAPEFRSSVFKTLTDPHFAIIPNIRADKPFQALWQEMGDDERALFRLIAVRLVMTLSPDYEYAGTVIKMKVPCISSPGAANPGGEGAELVFSAGGSVGLADGWKALLPHRSGIQAVPAEEDADGDEEEGPALPAVVDGQVVRLAKVDVVERDTQPPARIKSTSLTSEMKRAHAYIRDEHLRKVLQHAKGIGTPATRSAIIAEALHYRVIEKVRGYVVPSERTFTLWSTMHQIDPGLYDVAWAAEWQEGFHAIASGRLGNTAFLDKVAAEIGRHIEVLKAQAPLPLEVFQGKAKLPKVAGGGRKPSSAQPPARKPSSAPTAGTATTFKGNFGAPPRSDSPAPTGFKSFGKK